MSNAWIYTLAPVLMAVIAAIFAVNLRPGPVIVSAIQHFAAGVVFAAAAGEILPDVMHGGSPVATLVGGTVGVIVMLMVRQLENLIKGPVGLMTMIGIDVLVDGLVLGIAFAAGGAQAGLLLTVALTLEVAFLALALVTELSAANWTRIRIVGITASIMLLLPFGAILATPVATMSDAVVTGFLSFGLIALLYLVTEELLVEAHETPDRPWVTAMFFAGFLLLLSLEEVLA
ncbi:zinc transporter, ZIP family [Loktanella atrilutea]|uniref:Zinc transporter, ZIP family n=1 Tax=Loktanella atrilutea TaxID=366533 RepID=A0A1M5FDI8_LOKAT|nr:transporter [Loktanella atrilutea]SHF89605.1 zinc transporter, ZIP family [Loktanella atrilutea]